MAQASQASTTRLAVDVGGTFTDLVLENAGRRTTLKVLTTPRFPEQGILSGITQILDKAGIGRESIGFFLHGTTLATNALIERKGARTALLTTLGFRDSVEMAYENRFEQYDLDIERPSPLVPRELRLGVKERITAGGDILVPLDRSEISALIPTLKKNKIESVAIGFLHSYINPKHERMACEWLQDELPDVTITLSSEVSPEIREYDRLSTACANAYVQPLMATYLDRLERGLRELGITAPIFLMLSSGAMTTIDIGIRFPVRLVEGGPAGGAILCSHIAAQCEFEHVLAFDMGGTTAKICLVDKFQPQTSRNFEVARAYRFLKGSGLPLKIPVVEMVEIGAGGGSIAKIDSVGRLAVGPESAGSEPGPICYDRGGTDPTVTDADLTMRWLDPQYFAGGRIQLEARAAKAAVEANVGEPLGLDAQLASFAISEVVVENMASAARLHAIERGKSLEGRTLIVTGGAAPLHAARLADKLGIDRLVVPVSAGVGSAAGFLKAPVAYEVVRSRYQRLDRLEIDLINNQFKEMRAESESVVTRASSRADLQESRFAFMRYVGQGHEISVPLPARDLTSGDHVSLLAAFEEVYRQLYRRVIPGHPVEILSWTLNLSVATELPPRIQESASKQNAPASGSREAFDPASGGLREVSLFRRTDLAPGHRIDGPAIVSEDETTVVVPSNFSVTVNAAGYLVMDRRKG